MRRLFFYALALLLFVSCAEISEAPTFVLRPVAYDDLKGWETDHQSEALVALGRSCEAFRKKSSDTALRFAGQVRDWLPVCEDLDRVADGDDSAARRFLEARFTPYSVNEGDKGLFTGYYEAELRGAEQQGGVYQTPLWARPNDLITVDLGEFHEDLKGKKITGKAVGAVLKPYDDRAAIAAGSLNEGRAKPLFWVDDPIDVFFLEIQGSGRVIMSDGSVVRVGYDAQNGKTYVPIGRVLMEEGKLEKPVTMQKIRAWLREHPDRAQETMNRNPSAVFFRRLEEDGPVGAQGVVLTPGRSLAVDRSFLPLGLPVWLVPDEDGVAPLPRLVVAQDTGGAIKGPVRGDFFWGHGAEAEARAGAMQSTGVYYVLLPKTVAPP